MSKRFHDQERLFYGSVGFLLGFIEVYILYFGTRTKEVRHTSRAFKKKEATLVFLKMWELYEVSVWCIVQSDPGISIQ